MIRVIVCGPRDFTDAAFMDRVLSAFHRRHGISCIIEGECPTPVNADKLARLWGEGRGIPVDPCPVDHALDGPWPGAGPRRNRRMRDTKQPDAGIAIVGARHHQRGSGTADMVLALKEVGLPVWEIAP